MKIFPLSLGIIVPILIGFNSLKSFSQCTDNTSKYATNIKYEHLSAIIKDTDFSLNTIFLAKFTDQTLMGNGINICQKEHRSFPTDIDLKNSRVITHLESNDETEHATKVASIMLGAGNSSPLNEGIVPKAKLYSIQFGNLFPEKDDFYLNNTISVINNSYGTEIENYYGQHALEYDALIKRIPTLFCVFSAGNIGFTTYDKGFYKNIQGMANLTGNFKMSKNTLSVGAIDQFGILTNVSSRGPAFDGRIKPEVVAVSNNGTSEAAAMASGIAALAQQAFKKQTDRMMNAATLKAILINSADDVGLLGIDHQTGFGNLNAYQALKTIQENRFWENTVNYSGQKEWGITVPNQVKKLKISLAWIDPPAPLNAATALVNDLDLELSTGLNTWKPWVLSTFPHADSLLKTAQRQKDNLNNIEQITVDNPSGGNYNISVKGNKVLVEGQRFSVAYQWEMKDAFSWIYPLENTKLLAQKTHILRWKSALKGNVGTLEYSINQGKTWQIITRNLNLTQAFYEWTTPDIFSSVQLRISTNDGQQFDSSNFTIAPELLVNPSFFCTDSVQLSWRSSTNHLPQETIYFVYKFDKNTNSWVKKNLVNKNTITLKGTNLDDFFAIEPTLPSGIIGIRSDLVSAINTGTFCFYKSINASVENEQVGITLSLATLNGIKNIIFQKVNLQGITVLKTISISTNIFDYTINDDAPDDGLNTYQATIVFNNGKSVITNSAHLFYYKNEPFWVYPNPLNQGSPLFVSTNESVDYTFKLYDITGKKYAEQIIYRGDNQVNLPLLPLGSYFYSLISQERNLLKKGKISIIE